MGTTYVDSAATGANNGTSWTDAYTSLGSTTGVAAGELILVDDGHVETQGGTWTWSNGTLTSPVEIISVDKADDSYSAGAHFDSAVNGPYWQGNLLVQGVTLDAADEALIRGGAGARAVCIDCTFDASTAGENWATTGETIYINCTFIHADSYISFQDGSVTEFYDCDLTQMNNSNLGLPQTGNGVADVLFQGCDLTTQSNFLNNNNLHGRYIIRQCKIHASLVATSGIITHPSGFVSIENSASGTITIPPLWINERKTSGGQVQSSTAKYRTGGADDGEQSNAHSWTLTGNSSTGKQNRLFAPEIVRWVDADVSTTITLFVAHNAVGAGTAGALTNDQFGFFLFGPRVATATARAQFTDNMRRLQTASATDLTTDSSSTWNGTGVGTKQKVTYTWTPDTAGPVVVRPWLAANVAVQVDPLVDVT